mmetsp:Transcript_36994/g.104430  ORF Transcript_36994/g.104430 Transcript_36994/m.104430 type:complete len:359 (-) Transcript_36994:73-1149(-)
MPPAVAERSASYGTRHFHTPNSLPALHAHQRNGALISKECNHWTTRVWRHGKGLPALVLVPHNAGNTLNLGTLNVIDVEERPPPGCHQLPPPAGKCRLMHWAVLEMYRLNRRVPDAIHLEQANLLVQARRHQQLSVGVEFQALNHALRRPVHVGVLAAGHVNLPAGERLAATVCQETPCLPEDTGGICLLLLLLLVRGCGLLGLLGPLGVGVELPVLVPKPRLIFSSADGGFTLLLVKLLVTGLGGDVHLQLLVVGVRPDGSPLPLLRFVQPHACCPLLACACVLFPLLLSGLSHVPRERLLLLAEQGLLKRQSSRHIILCEARRLPRGWRLGERSGRQLRASHSIPSRCAGCPSSHL